MQGVSQLYEVSRKWSEYARTLEKLAHLHATAYATLSISSVFIMLTHI